MIDLHAMHAAVSTNSSYLPKLILRIKSWTNYYFKLPTQSRPINLSPRLVKKHNNYNWFIYYNDSTIMKHQTQFVLSKNHFNKTLSIIYVIHK
ncbi:hypothetical protein Hanom_Chr05g00406311 [Helianthus anomalus]